MAKKSRHENVGHISITKAAHDRLVAGLPRDARGHVVHGAKTERAEEIINAALDAEERRPVLAKGTGR